MSNQDGFSGDYARGESDILNAPGIDDLFAGMPPIAELKKLSLTMKRDQFHGMLATVGEAVRNLSHVAAMLTEIIDIELTEVVDEMDDLETAAL